MKKILFLIVFFLFENSVSAGFFLENWGMQRENFKIETLEKANHEVLILPIQKENGNFWSPAEIYHIKKNGKKVLAAFPLGEVSFGRFAFEEAQGEECKGQKTGFSKFWNPRTQQFDYEENCREESLFGEEIEDRGGTFLVQFWTEEWKKMAIDPLFEKAYSADFDGVFLEKIESFEMWAGKDKEKKKYFANEMAKIIIGMSSQARAKKGDDFLIIASEGSEIFENLSAKARKDFLSSIDAVAEVSLFFDTTRKSRMTRVAHLLKYVVHTKKPILLLEFSSKKNEKKLQEWQEAFSKIGLPAVIFRAENDENMNELPAPFMAK